MSIWLQTNHYKILFVFRWLFQSINQHLGWLSSQNQQVSYSVKLNLPISKLSKLMEVNKLTPQYYILNTTKARDIKNRILLANPEKWGVGRSVSETVHSKQWRLYNVPQKNNRGRWQNPLHHLKPWFP